MAIKKLARKNKAHFYGIYDNEKFIGLIYNIYYKDIVFIFYLAIDKETRGKGYGSKILEFIKQTYTKQRIILCIEQMDKNSMLYYNEDDKTVEVQEYKELMKDYFGKILYQYFYKKN